jgi:hypothetical protein
MNYKIILGYVMGAIIIGGFLFLFGWINNTEQAKADHCRSLGECEIYKCFGDNVAPTYLASNNYYLRYQNCLIEKGSLKK